MASITAASSHMWHLAKRPLPIWRRRLRNGIHRADGSPRFTRPVQLQIRRIAYEDGFAAEADNGFKSDAIKSEFMKNLKAITAANVENGAGGMLTSQVLTNIRALAHVPTSATRRCSTTQPGRWQDCSSVSGEARATESGENFARGFNAASNNKLANSTVTPADPAGTGEAAAPTRRRTRCTSTSPKTRTALRKPVRPSSVPTITRTSWKTMRLSQALSKPSPKTRT